MGYAATPPIERFRRKIKVTETGCWQWTGYLIPTGYAYLAITRSRNVAAHRWSYEYHVGPIPEGFQIDHLCRNRGCVSPDHLEAVTPRENTLRGNAPSVQAARAGTCMAGHPPQ